MISRRWAPTRRVSSTKKGSSPSESSARRQSRTNMAITLATTVVTLATIEVAVEVTTLCTPPMSLAMRRLHLAGARAGEERERQPLQVAVHGRAQVVHHPLADLVGEQRLVDAEDAGGDRDRRSSRPPAWSAGRCRARAGRCRGPPSAGTARSCRGPPRGRSAPSTDASRMR